MSQPPFPEPTFGPPGWPPPADTGFNSTAHMLEGRYWVSFDHQHWWNGTAWVPGLPPPQGPMIPNVPAGGVGLAGIIVALIGLGLFAVIAIGVCSSMSQSAIPGAPMP